MKKENSNDPSLFDRSTLSALFVDLELCKSVFVERKSSELLVIVDSYVDAFMASMNIATPSILLSLNLNHNKLGYLHNVILKTSIVCYLISSVKNYNAEATKNLIKTTLVILYGITPRVIQIKREPDLLKQLKSGLKQAALITFKSLKIELKSNPDVLRLLSQLANINEYSNKSQVAQSVVLTSINSAFLMCPLTAANPQTAASALSHAIHFPLLINNKNFVSNVLYDVPNKLAPVLDFGSMTRLQSGEFAVLIDRSASEIKNRILLSFKNKDFSLPPEIINVTNLKVRIIVPQSRMDLLQLTDYLAVHNQLNNAFSALKILFIGSSAVNYLPLINLTETSKVLQSENNPLITDYINRDALKAELIMRYAQENNRNQQPINDLKHALALLGTTKIYPVVCLSEMKLQQSDSRYLGSFEVINKEEQFSQIVFVYAKLCRIDIPEYCELMSRILFQGLMTVPKSRYSACVSINISALKKFKDIHSISQIFADTPINSWQKATMNLLKNWQMPKLYQATIRGFFDVKKGAATVSSLPTTIRHIVILLLVSEWFYIECLIGGDISQNYDRIASNIKQLGFSLTEFKELSKGTLNQVTLTSNLL